MLCSILIPTRFRLEGLRVCMFSFSSRAAGKEKEYEFVIRMHRDDLETLVQIPTLLESYPNLRIIIGENMRGFDSLGDFYEEMAAIAKGDFVWLINDDEEVSGDWFSTLFNAPRNALLKPETYQLNKSVYVRNPDCGTVVMPNQIWKKYGATIPASVDLAMYELLVKNNGHALHYLTGITSYHHRKVDRTLLPERF